MLTSLAARAWRRPLTPSEVDGLLALWQKLAAKEGKDEAVKLCVRALLVSSHFLYRVSVPGAYTSAAFGNTPGSVPLDDYALASRLCYFLWSSMPDEALFEDARSGALREDAGMRAAVSRMLHDKKASALVDGFAEQWLQVRALSRVVPEPAAYPTFDEPLRAAMGEEAKRFFQDFLSNGLPLTEMLTPSFGFLNDRLATHYDLPKPGSTQLIHVDLPTGARAGLLTEGAWLTATSESTRTSPVRRGRFVLEQLLCSPVPPMPDVVPPFEESEKGGTIRETLASHRTNAACAACHNLMDPVGLGLEEMDGIGAHRTLEAGRAVDSSGALPPDATPFVGAAQFAQLLKADPRFSQCLARKLMTYGFGRQVGGSDEPALAAISSAAREQGASLAELIEKIVLSRAFRGRSANLED